MQFADQPQVRLFHFDNNVLKFIPFTHLLWGLWALNSHLMKIDYNNFDYYDYAKKRLKEINIILKNGKT